MLFCWFTTRRREVGVGYGWLLRGTYLVIALIGLVLGVRYSPVAGREFGSLGVVITVSIALGVSIARRRAGVSAHRAEHDRRTARVAAMTGIDRQRPVDDDLSAGSASGARRREFPPVLDLVPVLFGAIGLIAAGAAAAGSGADDVLAIGRTLVGAAFLGAISDAMLLGHWYLVQPGLPRRLLNELVSAVGWLWPAEVGLLLLPPGMVQVWSGAIDDGWGGMLGWFWAACAIGTIVLVIVTKAALRERGYSAVMAATGLLYLAILTAFGTDLVARAILETTG